MEKRTQNYLNAIENLKLKKINYDLKIEKQKIQKEKKDDDQFKIQIKLKKPLFE